MANIADPPSSGGVNIADPPPFGGPNLLYICRESSTNQLFYAKQTQFPKSQNERKLFNYKGL